MQLLSGRSVEELQLELAGERKKVAREKNRQNINLYVEEFKVRRQELFDLERENDRWTT